MTASPPEDPDGSGDGRDEDDELDFDAEFARIISDWTPSEPESSGTAGHEGPSEHPDPDSDVLDPRAEAQRPGDERTDQPPSDDGLRHLLRQAWPDPAPVDDGLDEHFVPPPPPPIPRPEPRRLLAWSGLVVAPIVGLLWLVLGSLPSYGSFLLFCWFVGGFCYLIASMGDGPERDGWDDGARL